MSVLGKTVEEMARQIAPTLSLCFPQHKSKLYEVLTLANQKIWKKGKWRGMTREYYTRVRDDGTVVNPHGYDILLKVNLNKCPVTLRTEYFQFHKNGNGSQTECCGKNWTTDVHDRGLSPVIYQPFKPESCCCNTPKCQKIKLAVKSSSCEESCQFVTIYGCFPDGRAIYSYKCKDENVNSVPCDEEEAKSRKLANFEVVEGVQIPITDEVYILDNYYFGEIRAIQKPPTFGTVDILAINEHDDSMNLISRIDPPYLGSVYRIWQVPKICGQYPCVHGLWKVSKPGKFINDNQRMSVDDDEAILAMATGIHKQYYQDDPVGAVPYYETAINALTDDEEQNASEAFEEPIQNHDIYTTTINRKRRRMRAY